MLAQWISLGITVLVMGFNVAFFIILKFNDFSHLERAVKSINDKLDKIDTKLDDNSERISLIEGRCLANHKL